MGHAREWKPDEGVALPVPAMIQPGARVLEAGRVCTQDWRGAGPTFQPCGLLRYAVAGAPASSSSLVTRRDCSQRVALRDAADDRRRPRLRVAWQQSDDVDVDPPAGLPVRAPSATSMEEFFTVFTPGLSRSPWSGGARSRGSRPQCCTWPDACSEVISVGDQDYGHAFLASRASEVPAP